MLKKGETKLYKIGGGRMKENAGHSNLIPASKQTPEERRRNGRKGGIASGIARNERKTLKEQLLILLENGDTQKEVSLALISKALTGDTKAFEVIRDTIGEKPKEQIEQKQELKIVMDDKLEEWGK